MKCPKCGFNSFEYYDSCKKCSTDLTGYKQTYSIASVVLPLEAKEKLVTQFKSDESVIAQTSENIETHDDIFSFDLPDDLPSTPSQNNDDPFNFDEPATDIKQVDSSKTDEDVFADLLETTSQADESPFATASVVSAATPVVAKAEQPSTPGEFDLESFSWDEAPSVASSSATPVIEDDFDSLFGDTKEK